jgi:hypothetical protein
MNFIPYAVYNFYHRYIYEYWDGSICVLVDLQHFLHMHQIKSHNSVTLIGLFLKYLNKYLHVLI